MDKEFELLQSALTMILGIKDLMKEHSPDPYTECPFCMGELFDEKDNISIQKIQDHIDHELAVAMDNPGVSYEER
jgi:hypothetical protein